MMHLEPKGEFFMSAEQLRQAYDLIRQGRKRDAVAMLQPILSADRQNADAWWLLANALTEPEKQRDALRRLIELRPDDARAHKMLDRIEEQLQPKVNDFSFPDSEADDPFARSSSSPFPGSSSGDPFASSSDPFMGSDKPKRTSAPVYAPPPQRRSGNNGCLVALAIIGALTLGCCVLSFVGVSQGLIQLPAVFQEIILTLTVNPGFGELQTMFGTPEPFDMSDARDRGEIAVGESINGNVDTFDDDFYTFNARSGQQVTIDVITRSDLDPQLYVYDKDNRLIGQNDDIDMSNDNFNSRLSVTFPASGAYYLVVSAFGSGGTYEISVSE